MTNSLSYYLTIAVIKLKGIKRSFGNDPIDYKKLRKEDVFLPNNSFFKRHTLNKYQVLSSTIIEVGTKKEADSLVLFIHGGAFVSGPAKHHWDAIKTIVKQTSHTVWLCRYPKAPEYDILQISKNIDALYSLALEKYSASKIYIIGDSVGGTLATALIQRLIALKKELPKKILLISPVMDASMSNPAIQSLEEINPMLSIQGVVSAKKMCAGFMDLKAPIISPIYGSFDQFPSTLIFMAQHDIMYPNQKIALSKLLKAKVDVKSIEGKRMPHIWPLLPFMKEAKIALQEITKALKDS